MYSDSVPFANRQRIGNDIAELIRPPIRPSRLIRRVGPNLRYPARLINASVRDVCGVEEVGFDVFGEDLSRVLAVGPVDGEAAFASCEGVACESKSGCKRVPHVVVIAHCSQVTM